MKRYAFIIFLGLLVSASAEESAKVELPPSLSRLYSQFVAACKSGDQAKIKSFFLPGIVEISLTPRIEHQEYGADLNLPFMQKRFSEQIMGTSRLSASAYSIRTATSYISFVETSSHGWKIFRYGDKPIE